MKRLLAALALLFFPLAAGAAEPAKVDARHPFRTDFANENLPWYQLRPGQFPPHHSAHRVGGELIEADFIHRAGVFRMNRTGELVNFKLPPFGAVHYLNAEASLRDLPLGTDFLFFLHQDANGEFTQVASMQDQFTIDASHRCTYRLDEARLAEGKLLVTKQSAAKDEPELGKSELLVTERTRVWKGAQQIKLTDLVAGDALLFNRTGHSAQNPSRCIDLWVGAETHESATTQQRKRHTAYLKERGLPGWIDGVEGGKLTVTLFGAGRDSLKELFKEDGIDPALWAKERRSVHAVVTNEDLRTYNPPVDKQASVVHEVRQVPTNRYGCSGEQWVIEPRLLLEGFRKGRIVRLFVSPSWKIADMPFGEGLYTEVPAAETREPSRNQYPFRTDFANADQPWYQLRPGEFPPYFSEHRVSGELVKVDAAHRAGQFRTDRTGELVDFTLPPFGTVQHLNAEADLADVPLGTRCLFYLHPDEKGAFTKASVVLDEFTWMASNKIAFRLDALPDEQGRLLVGRQIALVKNYNGDMVRPPDLGRTFLSVDARTRVWKGATQIPLHDLAVGDELLVNLTGRTATDRGRVTDMWVGAETQDQATNAQRKKQQARLQTLGLPAWIESVEGKRLTIIFFAASRNEFTAMMKTDPKGQTWFTALADEKLSVIGPLRDAVRVVTSLPEVSTAGTHGCSGVRWLIEPKELPAGYRPGQILRVFKDAGPASNATVSNSQK